MGKQIGFYMNARDEQEFIEFVRSDRNVGIFLDIQQSEQIQFLSTLPERETPGWFLLCLWDLDHSPPPKLSYIDQRGYYSVDRIESEVIEFSRCILDDDRLVRGRIWAEMSAFQAGGSLVSKSDSFKTWFDRLSKWIKRTSVRKQGTSVVLPGAVEYEEKGKRLVQAVFGDSVTTFQHRTE